MIRAGVAFALVVLLTGCAGSAGSAASRSPEPSEPALTGDGVAGSTGTGELLCTEPAAGPAPKGCEAPDPLGEGQLVEPVPGVDDAHPVNWELAEPSASGQGLVVTWVGGVQECYGLDRVEVSETEAEVRVTVYEGALASAAGQACIDLGVVKRTDVPLGAPLGDRAVVDGGE